MFEEDEVNIVIENGNVHIWEDGVEYIPDIYVESVE